MSDKSDSSINALGLVRKNWWLVMIVVFVALAVAAWTLRDVQTTYTVSAQVTMRPEVVRNQSLLLPEEAVAYTSSDEFAEIVAGDSSITVAEYHKGSESYASGAYREHIFLKYTGADEAQAQQVAESMALRLVEYAQSTASDEIARAQKQVELTQDMIAVTEAVDPSVFGTSTEGGAFELSRRVYDLRMQLIKYEDAENALSAAYTYSGSATASVTTILDEAIRPLAGALLAGLAIGVSLAWVKG